MSAPDSQVFEVPLSHDELLVTVYALEMFVASVRFVRKLTDPRAATMETRMTEAAFEEIVVPVTQVIERLKPLIPVDRRVSGETQ
jgi:hypothetical protein